MAKTSTTIPQVNTLGSCNSNFHRPLQFLRTLPLALVLLTLPSPSFSDSKTPKPPALVDFENGVAEMNAKEFDKAESSFKKALEIDPQFAAPYLGLADIHQHKGDISGAGALLQKALALAPESAAVQTAWGQYLFAQERFSEAQKAYNNAIRLDPKSAAPLGQLGDLYLLGLKKPLEAVKLYRASLDLNPADAHVNFMLAGALLGAGESQEAEAQLVKTRNLDPQNIGVRKMLAELELRQGDLDGAIEDYGKALETSPNAIWAAIGIGDVWMRRRDYDHAIVAYRKALAITPGSAEATAKMGSAQESKSDLVSAEASYRQALTLDPTNGMAANNLAWLLGIKEGKPKEALAFAKKAVAANSKNPNFLDTQAWILRAIGDGPGALAILKQAAAMAPSDPTIYYHLGVAYQDRRESRLASEAYRKALSLNQDFPDAEDAKARADALKSPK
jgi:tetratricopeptide (TPR) repeat protein